MKVHFRILPLLIIALMVVLINQRVLGIVRYLPPGSDILTANPEKAGNLQVNGTPDLNLLNNSLKENLISGNYAQGKKITEELIKALFRPGNDSSLIADSYYYIGIYYKLVSDYTSSNKYLQLSISLRERLNIYDAIYAKALYNLGGNFAGLGAYGKHKEFTIRALEVDKNIYGPENGELVSTYGSLITAYIELKDYDNALNLAEIAYAIAEKDSANADPQFVAFLYNNMGILYNSIGDYSKSRIFFEKSEEFYIKSGKTSEDGYISLMNSMSNSLRNLGLNDEADRYYKKGVDLAKKKYNLSSFQLLSRYASDLGKSGKVSEGESVFANLIKEVIAKEGRESQSYYELLSFYADYLRKFNIDGDRTREYYESCINYFDKLEDSFLKFFVKEGYALILSAKGEYPRALEILQTLLFPDYYSRNDLDIFVNPDPDSINADKDFLETLRTKNKVLKEYYGANPDLKILKARVNTSERVISILDKIRINISEEESRLILGDSYRDSYMEVIGDFYLLYSKTSDAEYLRKSFEYTEKSKIAGLLTSTRELKATEFHIPLALAEEERTLTSEITILNDRISGKSEFGITTGEIVNIWKSNLFNTVRRRDSLIKVFEKDYPDYYSIKYSTHVAAPEEIPDIIGNNSNYISFVASDSVIYISVVNRKANILLPVSVDSSFYLKIKKFRSLLSSPDFDNAREAFNDFQLIGSSLYNTLITPVLPYLISNRIVISPDNLISYIPFETLPVNTGLVESLSYKKLTYMMEQFDLSYTYSATLMSENNIRSKQRGDRLIAFAPDYSNPVDINKVFQIRQQSGNTLSDLPYARQEAEYVAKLMGGRLYLNSQAKESVFKKEAGKYDIIHLSMHTIIDDKNPMYSTLIFSPDSSGSEDRFLRTFEIYGIPLKAKMVVLSSCNTGSGKLSSGEGVLSLARGFIYSGSESVVMAMWEIEDRAGTDIVKLYYDFLKKGYSKSMSLRKARIKFLKDADPLRSHPYFWSSLVIYGDDTALYNDSRLCYALAVLVVIILFLIVYYVRKRRYS